MRDLVPAKQRKRRRKVKARQLDPQLLEQLISREPAGT
jgi:hypothetical protein